MYSEKTFKNYIFWVQVKRVFIMIVLTIIGATLGILIGKILESTVKVTAFNNMIIVVSTIIFFLISLLLTIGTGKQVQDGYWKIAVLRKLTAIQKSLELNNELLKNNGKSKKVNSVSKASEVNEYNSENEDDYNDARNLYKFDDNFASSEMKKVSKTKKAKTLKMPEELIK